MSPAFQHKPMELSFALLELLCESFPGSLSIPTLGKCDWQSLSTRIGGCPIYTELQK